VALFFFSGQQSWTGEAGCVIHV